MAAWSWQLGALLSLMQLVHFISAEATVHTVITTECTSYFTWQTMGAEGAGYKGGHAPHLGYPDVTKLIDKLLCVPCSYSDW